MAYHRKMGGIWDIKWSSIFLVLIGLYDFVSSFSFPSSQVGRTFQNPVHIFQMRRNSRKIHLKMIFKTGGPNKDQPPEFFEDYNNLEAEIKFYLEDREKQEIQEQQKNNNPILSFFSLDEESMTSNKMKKIQKKQLDILSYAELLKYGYKYLIDPISNQGGYIEISKKMGIPVEFDKPADDGVKIVRIEASEERGGLSLGSSLEDKLEKINEVDWKAKQNDILAGQRRMVAVDKLDDNKSPEYVKAAEPDEQEVELVHPPQPIQLNALQRLYTVLFVFLSAFGNGRSTTEVAAMFDIPDSTVNICQSFAFGLLFTNVLSCLASSYIASTKSRSIPLWLFKGLVSGIPALLEIKSADDWSNLEQQIEK